MKYVMSIIYNKIVLALCQCVIFISIWLSRDPQIILDIKAPDYSLKNSCLWFSGACIYFTYTIVSATLQLARMRCRSYMHSHFWSAIASSCSASCFVVVHWISHHLHSELWDENVRARSACASYIWFLLLPWRHSSSNKLNYIEDQIY